MHIKTLFFLSYLFIYLFIEVFVSLEYILEVNLNVLRLHLCDFYRQIDFSV